MQDPVRDWRGMQTCTLQDMSERVTMTCFTHFARVVRPAGVPTKASADRTDRVAIKNTRFDGIFSRSLILYCALNAFAALQLLGVLASLFPFVFYGFYWPPSHPTNCIHNLSNEPQIHVPGGQLQTSVPGSYWYEYCTQPVAQYYFQVSTQPGTLREESNVPPRTDRPWCEAMAAGKPCCPSGQHQTRW